MLFIDPYHYLQMIEYAIFLTIAILTIFAFRKMNLELIRARAFLSKDFLRNNYISVTIAGSLLAFHEFVEIGYEIGILHHPYHIFSEILGNLSLIFLIFWMYSWWKLKV